MFYTWTFEYLFASFFLAFSVSDWLKCREYTSIENQNKIFRVDFSKFYKAQCQCKVCTVPLKNSLPQLFTINLKST